MILNLSDIIRSGAARVGWQSLFLRSVSFVNHGRQFCALPGVRTGMHKLFTADPPTWTLRTNLIDIQPWLPRSFGEGVVGVSCFMPVRILFCLCGVSGGPLMPRGVLLSG